MFPMRELRLRRGLIIEGGGVGGWVDVDGGFGGGGGVGACYIRCRSSTCRLPCLVAKIAADPLFVVAACCCDMSLLLAY